MVRLLVDGLTRVAVTMRQAALQVLIRPGATELELAVALEELSLDIDPLLDPMINGLARLALRHMFQTEAVNAAERAAGQRPGARPSPWRSPTSSGSPKWARRSRPRTSFGLPVGSPT